MIVGLEYKSSACGKKQLVPAYLLRHNEIHPCADEKNRWDHVTLSNVGHVTRSSAKSEFEAFCDLLLDQKRTLK